MKYAKKMRSILRHFINAGAPHSRQITPQTFVYWSIQATDGLPNKLMTGQSLVSPEGMIELGPYGSVRVAGMNSEQARSAVERQLSRYLKNPKVTLSLAEMDQGSWVIFELPGFTTAASGTEKASMDALRQANETSYFRDGDALWVKLVAAAPVMPVIRPTDLQASISVSRDDHGG